ncbi:hypothetical protein L5G28_09730 [Gordonia sp. HY285]|uniref:hypothetical protein n=1 Tax=Gordonia liuliyuniae TaxID=2911517 RepID=UPI001F2CA159|nr:hypothetical protein [Gordonia liuliyuniae]MCF8610434.1 hypothetical protein [Gordonia liuliyuniae]
MSTPRIAVHGAESVAADWIELTDGDVDAPVTRVRASSLGEAAQATARASGPVFVDLDVHLADTVRAAYAEYAAAHPGWTPGARTGTLVHPGTVATLVGLLRDIAVTGVADGVTLRGPDASVLIRQVIEDVAPILGVRVHDWQVVAG